MKTNGNSDTNASTGSKEEEVQTAALQDEFTKEFIPSAEETEEGYYTFESGIGGYTMLYPINATMDQTYYQYKGQSYEAIYFSETQEENNYGYSVRGRFEDRTITQWVESNLDLLIGSTDSITVEDFEKYTVNDNDVYFAEYTQEISEEEDGFTYHFLSYVKSQANNKAMSISYSSSCMNEKEECALNLDQERDRAKKIFHSIKFVQ